MATITGTIYFASNAAAAYMGLTFVPQETPGVVSGAMVVARDVRVALTSGGDLPAALELTEGRYTVRLDNGEEFDIDVPSGSGTHDIIDLVVAADGVSVTEYAISGHGTPEGARQGHPGYLYTDLDTGILWRKISGTGTTGWEQLIA